MKIAGIRTKIAVGGFVLAVIALAGVSILFLGDGLTNLGKQQTYQIMFRDASGLQVGAPVKMGGLPVGRVTSLRLMIVGDGPAAIAKIAVQDPEFNLIKVDTMAELQTQGVLGDRFVGLIGGSPQAQILAADSDIKSVEHMSISELTSRAETVLAGIDGIVRDVHAFTNGLPTGTQVSDSVTRLAKTTGSLESVVANAEKVIAKVDKGKGTLGLLLNDPGLYDDAKALLGGTNRSQVARTLVHEAVKNAQAHH